MSDHDPLCAAHGRTWKTDYAENASCECYLIRKVRADEVGRHEQEIARAIQTTTVMVRKHVAERVAQAIEAAGAIRSERVVVPVPR